jgi:hypothetical protein
MAFPPSIRRVYQPSGVLSAQGNCGDTQLPLSADYSYAIGSSDNAGAYSLSVGGKTIAQGTSPQLALMHFDGSMAATNGEPEVGTVATAAADDWALWARRVRGTQIHATRRAMAIGHSLLIGAVSKFMNPFLTTPITVAKCAGRGGRRIGNVS